MGNNYKTCIKCQKELPATREFFYKGDCKFGFSNICKICSSIWYKQYYKDNKDKNNKRSKKWQDDNSDRVKEYNKQYREINRERRNRESKERYIKNADYAKEYWKQYYETNREKCNKATKKWSANNADHVKKHRKQYYEDNKERCKEQGRKWRIKNSEHRKQYQRNNRDKHNASLARYRARKLNQTPPNANMELIRFYYTVASTLKDYQVDHMKPLNKGGLHHEDNLQLLEASLNQQKRDKWPLTPEEEIKYKGYKLGVRSLIKKY